MLITPHRFPERRGVESSMPLAPHWTGLARAEHPVLACYTSRLLPPAFPWYGTS
jgi:hypothetical protein